MLERYEKSDVNPISTPALTNEHLTKLLLPEVDAKSYQRALGALMYPMLGTRPDLAYAIEAHKLHKGDGSSPPGLRGGVGDPDGVRRINMITN
jgi:hypothetical protein